MITFDQVTKTSPTGDTVLKDVSFHIEPQEFVVIAGHSGAGKTTIFKLIFGQTHPTSGQVTVDGTDVASLRSSHLSSYRRKIGYAFQDFKIIPDKTVWENIALALEILDYQDKLIKERLEHLLELTGLTRKSQLFPTQLSGGELQRVAIARALAAEPSILLADEPTGNLDEVTATGIIKLLEQINSLGTTVIVATHSPHLITHPKVHHIAIKEGVITDSLPSHPKAHPKAKENKKSLD